MKSVKVSISFPKASELQNQLDKVISKMNNTLKIDLDTKSFNKSLSDMSSLISKLKSQLADFNILEKLNSDGTSVAKTAKEVNNLAEAMGKLNEKSQLRRKRDEETWALKDIQAYNKAMDDSYKSQIKLEESLEKTRTSLQNKLNSSLGNQNFTLIDDSVFTDLQNKINSINTNMPEKEINELKIALSNLNNSDSQIVRLQNAISKYEISISNLKERYKDLVPTNELTEAESKINNLKDTLSNIQSGDIGLTNKNISNILNEASNSMKNLSSATKNASEQQRLYNKEIVTFGSAFKDAFAKVGFFDLAYSSINEVKNAFRDGIQSVIEMDTQLSNLQKVIDGLSDKQLIQMRDSAISMGEALGRSASEITASMAEFGRQYKNTEDIERLTEVAIIARNTMDNISADSVSKALTTILSSMHLGIEDAMSIVDALNEVQNNFRIQSEDMLNGIAEVGSVAYTSGVSLNQLQGYLTAIIQSTGESGSQVGNALQTIFSRIYGTGKSTLEGLGVAVTDLNGEFRSVSDILDDYYKKWQTTMSESEKIKSSMAIAGVQRYNQLVSLMNNYETAINATETAMNSLNSASNENEIYVNSIEGRIESLKASTEGFWNNFIDSDMIKGGVSALQLLMSVLDGLQNTFGGLGLTVGTLTTAFLIFTNNPLKKLSTNVASNGKILKGLSTELTNLVAKIKTTATATGTLNSSMTTTQKTGALLKTGFSMLGDSAVVTQVKILALQTVLSASLGLAISAVIGVVSSFVSSLMNADEATEKVNASAKELSDTLTSVSDSNIDLKTYRELNEKLKDAKLTEEERNDLNNQLVEVKEKLYSIDDEAYAILNNQNLTYQEQLDLLRAINDEKLKERGRELDKSLGNGFWRQDEGTNAKQSAEMLENQIALYKEADELFKHANGEWIQLSNGAMVATKNQREYLEDLKNSILENSNTVQKYNSNVELIKKTNADTNRSTVELSDSVRNFISDLNASTDAINENTQAKEKNAQVNNNNESSDTQVNDLSNLQRAYESLGYSVDDVKDKMEDLQELSFGEQNSQLIADSTEVYNESKNKVQELKEALEDLNEEQVVSSQLISELANTYPDILKLGSSIYDLSSVQEFLNSQIENQAQIQATAYENMISYDTEYYNNKIKNNEEFMQLMQDSINSFTDMQGQGYELDFNNFSSLHELKNGILNQFGDVNGNILNAILEMYAKSYTFDSNNFADLQSMKQGYLNQLLPAIANWIASK